jgi:hypothetical protein
MMAVRASIGISLCASIVACGGSDLGSSDNGSVAPASNVVSVTVSGGPTNNAVNVLYTTVTVCLPGTSTCQTIDNIQVDTGSYGLRILAPVLTLTFPVAKLNGSALVECTTFVDGYSWGPVTLADVQISGETDGARGLHGLGAHVGEHRRDLRRQRHHRHRPVRPGLRRYLCLERALAHRLLHVSHRVDLHRHDGAVGEPGAESRHSVRDR